MSKMWYDIWLWFRKHPKWACLCVHVHTLNMPSRTTFLPFLLRDKMEPTIPGIEVNRTCTAHSQDLMPEVTISLCLVVGLALINLWYKRFTFSFSPSCWPMSFLVHVSGRGMPNRIMSCFIFLLSEDADQKQSLKWPEARRTCFEKASWKTNFSVSRALN